MSNKLRKARDSMLDVSRKVASNSPGGESRIGVTKKTSHPATCRRISRDFMVAKAITKRSYPVVFVEE